MWRSKKSIAWSRFAALLFLAACSSAPKRPPEVFLQRNAAAAYLELANREADRGNYTGAWETAAEARRVAVSVDDPPLLIKTGLAQGNILHALGKKDEARNAWREALAEAERAGLAELAAVCRIHEARGRLLDMAQGGSGNIEEIRSQTAADRNRIKDKLYLALAWTVTGMAERESRRWAEAESALKKAYALHDAERCLEQAAYDWYLIGSTRSLSGNFSGALEALETALSYDRRSENSYGLGKDWFAIGEVNRKAGNLDQARSAYLRAADIFKAAGKDEAGE